MGERGFRVVWALVMVTAIFVAGGPAMADQIFSIDNSSSNNWAGYVAETNFGSPGQNSVDSVSGSWTVSAVTTTSSATYSASWVGIDGFSNSTVEQTGTLAISDAGVTNYYAWYEMYPSAMVVIDTITVHPGDQMSAAVQWMASGAHAGDFELTLTDVTRNHSYTTYQAPPAGYQRSSAEWIFEAPSDGTSILPLSGFTSVPFTNAQADIDGVVGAINDPSWQDEPINMFDPNGGTAFAGALTDPTQTTSDFTIYANAPEPATCVLLGTGLMGLAGVVRRKVGKGQR